MPNIDDKKLNRIIDANFNRAKEGLRVCEDTCRFILDRKSETRRYKEIRHRLTDILIGLKIRDVIRARDTHADVGRASTRTEFKRLDAMDVFYANSQRVKESVRVLEEFAKLRNKRVANGLKKLRYQIYALEKNIIEQS